MTFSLRNNPHQIAHLHCVLRRGGALPEYVGVDCARYFDERRVQEHIFDCGSATIAREVSAISSFVSSHSLDPPSSSVKPHLIASTVLKEPRGPSLMREAIVPSRVPRSRDSGRTCWTVSPTDDVMNLVHIPIIVSIGRSDQAVINQAVIRPTTTADRPGRASPYKTHLATRFEKSARPCLTKMRATTVATLHASPGFLSISIPTAGIGRLIRTRSTCSHRRLLWANF